MKLLGGFPQALRIEFRDGDRRGAGTMQKAVQVFEADGPRTNDRATKFFAHSWDGLQTLCRTAPDRGQ